MLSRMPEMDAPRALVFRPLVKGNEALGTKLGTGMHATEGRGRRRGQGFESHPGRKFLQALFSHLPTETAMSKTVMRSGV